MYIMNIISTICIISIIYIMMTPFRETPNFPVKTGPKTDPFLKGSEGSKNRPLSAAERSIFQFLFLNRYLFSLF